MNKNIRQHDRSDCGVACLASIAAHYRLRLPLSRLRRSAGTDQRGTTLLGLIKAAGEVGLSARGVRVKGELMTGTALPAIAHLKLADGSFHYVVVYGTRRRGLRIMDPATGGTTTWSRARFREAWTGVLLLLHPAEDFRAGDDSVTTLRRFATLLAPHRATLVQAMFGAILFTVLGLSTAVYVQKVTDFVLVSGNTGLLNLMGCGMLFLLALTIYLGIMKSIMVLRSGQLIDARLVLGYYRHLLRLPQRFFDTMRTGEILSRINDAVKIRAFVNDVCINLLVNVFIVLFSFALMFTYYWKLALVLLTVLPCYVLVYWISNGLNRRYERRLMERSADLQSQLVESVGGVRTLKQLNLQPVADQETEERFVGLLNVTYRTGLHGIFSSQATEALSRLFTLILLWVGAHYVIAQTISMGELLGFYALIGYFTGPARSLIHANRSMQQALIAAERLFEILDLEPAPVARDAICLTPELLGDIHFQNIDFAYGPGRPVFSGLDLKVRRGEVTGIVGSSGSGKSTLASLLLRLYEPERGKVRLGGIDLDQVCPDSLRRLVGIVPQQLDLFTGDIVDNVAVGDPSPDVHRVMRLCRELGLQDFVDSLPRGLRTSLGEGGVNLSGGQRQRLAIARALYRDPEILILDEATAALDTGSEAFVQDTVRRLRAAGKTVIIIAHRLTTLTEADRIVVLEAGQPVEEGTHRELLAHDATYANLWRRQFPVLPERGREAA